MMIIHLYHTLNGEHAPELRKRIENGKFDVIDAFGGKARLAALRRHFEYLRFKGVELYILSHSWEDVLHEITQISELAEFFPKDRIFGFDSYESTYFGTKKMLLAQDVIQRYAATSDNVVFVDDDYNKNLEPIVEEGIAHAVHVQAGEGMTFEHLCTVEMLLFSESYSMSDQFPSSCELAAFTNLTVADSENIVISSAKTGCSFKTIGHDYNGMVSKTKSGSLCLPWPQSHQSVANHNFCRNPNKDTKGPWCFSEIDDNVVVAHCDVGTPNAPKCISHTPAPTRAAPRPTARPTARPKRPTQPRRQQRPTQPNLERQQRPTPPRDTEGSRERTRK